MSTKRVLVTGASKGIGRAIAIELAKQGWKVAIHYGQDRAGAESVRSEIGDASSGLYGADLSQGPKTAAELVSRVESDGPLTAIVNNAGVYLPLDFTGSGDEVFEANYAKTFAVNFDSPLRIIREGTKRFATRGGGKIVNVASRVGFRGESGAALYSASKSALINVTRALAVELAPKNIQLFAIAPGWVETAMAREGMETRLPQILKDIPLGRMATPEDCAAATAFLLSDGASYLSGITIDINGASYFH